MGTDNLFKKRRARKTEDLARRAARRNTYQYVLIVCEGQKTEPLYFEDLLQHYQIPSANVEIVQGSGSSPSKLLNRAREKFKASKNKGNEFDRVYCVFDRDTWPCYHSTIQQIHSASPKGVFYYAVSYPCFEYWLLLHFTASARPYAPRQGNSIGNQVEDELKRYMPHYRKGSEGVFTELFGSLDLAIANSKRIWEAAARSESYNPSTNIHELVEYLSMIPYSD